MLPTVVLVGRPNVGKSTLFNKLTHRRDALVANIPGLTRDRRYGRLTINSDDEGHAASVHLVDTGGLFGEEDIASAMQVQVESALADADLVLLVVDAKAGLMPADHDILQRLRRRSLPVVLVVNKIDRVSEAQAQAEFSSLGVDPVLYVAAEHNRGMAILAEAVGATLQAQGQLDPNAALASIEELPGIRVALIGRPNVGKSTLINRLLGEERQVVFDAPGTTRDAIDIPFQRDGKDYVLIDTAGVRRKGKTDGIVEKFSVVKSLDAMARAQVVLMVVDAQEGLVEQDLHLLGYAVEAGCGIILVINKCDGLPPDARHRVEVELDRRLDFAPWINIRFISALHGTGVGLLWSEINKVYQGGMFDVSTTLLTKLLTGMVQAHPPPAVRGRAVKLRFAHKAGSHPPKVTIYGNQTQTVPPSYVRYLENSYRKALKVHGNPIHITLKTGENPYASKRNELTPTQRARRDRMISHRKKSNKKSSRR